MSDSLTIDILLFCVTGLLCIILFLQFKLKKLEYDSRIMKIKLDKLVEFNTGFARLMKEAIERSQDEFRREEVE